MKFKPFFFEILFVMRTHSAKTVPTLKLCSRIKKTRDKEPKAMCDLRLFSDLKKRTIEDNSWDIREILNMDWIVEYIMDIIISAKIFGGKL